MSEMERAKAYIATQPGTKTPVHCGVPWYGETQMQSAFLAGAALSSTAATEMAVALEEAELALRHAKSTFYRYAKLHRDKGTDEGDAKACANASMGEEMAGALETVRSALARHRGEA